MALGTKARVEVKDSQLQTRSGRRNQGSWLGSFQLRDHLLWPSKQRLRVRFGSFQLRARYGVRKKCNWLGSVQVRFAVAPGTTARGSVRFGSLRPYKQRLAVRFGRALGLPWH